MFSSTETKKGTNLLVLTIVPGHGAMGSLSLDSFTIRADEDGRHQSQGSKTWNQRDEDVC